ncbi:MAG: YihY/virulence factor BrkB family protein [Lachnospirales bacterium]
MKKYIKFTKEVIVKIYNNDLLTQANAMTFSMILAIFPIIIIMIASLSFFNIDITTYVQDFSKTLPTDVEKLLNSVLVDVFETRHISIISTSAVIALYSASSGIASMIKGMNKAFEKEVDTGPIVTRLMSVVFVFLFIVLIVLSLGLLIFSDVIASILTSLNLGQFIPHFLYSAVVVGIGMFAVIAFFVILHRVMVDKTIPLRNILPGVLFTVIVWYIASGAFNFYVNNFYRFSLLYGSIGTFLVLVIWLNILCHVILIGSQINAVLCDDNFMDSISN